MIPELPALSLSDIGYGWLDGPWTWVGAAMLSIAIAITFVPRKRK